MNENRVRPVFTKDQANCVVSLLSSAVRHNNKKHDSVEGNEVFNKNIKEAFLIMINELKSTGNEDDNESGAEGSAGDLSCSLKPTKETKSKMKIYDSSSKKPTPKLPGY